jgi:hypothetical protein
MLAWLKRMNEEKLPSDIVAINIGIFESKSGYVLYLVGSKEYDSSNSDWACNQDFVPKDKYFYVKDKNLNSLTWQEFLKTAGKSLYEIKEEQKFPSLILSRVQHITYGFDDGDLEVLI